MDYDSEEKRQGREYRRKIIADWKSEAKALQAADPSKRMLLREAKLECVRRIEESARTEADFEKVIVIWNNMKIVADWRIEKQEETHYELPDAGLTEHTTIIPEPLNHVWWRQQLRGNFLDSIYDCRYEIQELVSDRALYGYIKELDERHKELCIIGRFGNGRRSVSLNIAGRPTATSAGYTTVSSRACAGICTNGSARYMKPKGILRGLNGSSAPSIMSILVRRENSKCCRYSM